MNKSIFHDWVVDLDLKSQSSLLPVLRGCDMEHPELKKITKMLRYIIGKNFVKETKYSDDVILQAKDTARIIIDVGQRESMHWYEHIRYAIDTIQGKHPDSYVRYYWRLVVDEMNLLPKKEPHVYRMEKEYIDLKDKTDKLSNFINQGSDKVTEDQKEQLNHMKSYLIVLSKRLHQAGS